jgi:hypothetical protein
VLLCLNYKIRSETLNLRVELPPDKVPLLPIITYFSYLSEDETINFAMFSLGSATLGEGFVSRLRLMSSRLQIVTSATFVSRLRLMSSRLQIVTSARFVSRLRLMLSSLQIVTSA